MNKNQKKIIITGASSGLGLIAAETFAQMGWRVGAAARREAPLKELKAKYPEAVEWSCIDINEPDASDRLLELAAKLGGMDVYFHVSGICIENPELDTANDLKTVHTNVGGFTRMIDTAFNYFRDNRLQGRIAAITSVAGTKGIADLAAYSAAKRYQWTYIDALEQLARRDGIDIRFTDIRPGWTRTHLIDSNRRYLMSMDSEMVAGSAVKAILKGRRITYIDHRWSVMAFFWRRLPQAIWRLIPLRASQPK